MADRLRRILREAGEALRALLPHRLCSSSWAAPGVKCATIFAKRAVSATARTRPVPAASALPGSSAEVETIQLHHLVPGRDEVTHELLLRVLGGIALRQRAELRVRAEHQVDASGRPLLLAGDAIM